MRELLDCDLDAYSRLAVSLIVDRFPEWEPFAKLTLGSNGKGNVVDFNIPCPSSAAQSGLWISTADEELSVGFHTHHEHFTDYENRLNRDQIEAGIQRAADFVEERLGILSYYLFGAFSGSRSIDLPYSGMFPGLLDGSVSGMELETISSILPDWDRATLRSWFGRFDRDEVRS